LRLPEEPHRRGIRIIIANTAYRAGRQAGRQATDFCSARSLRAAWRTTRSLRPLFAVQLPFHAGAPRRRLILFLANALTYALLRFWRSVLTTNAARCV